MQPLPEGGLPPDQTIEGGAQIRVTPAGFEKFTSIIPEVVNSVLGAGFCIPRNQVVDAGIAEATLCGTNSGQCSPGCPVTIALDSTNITANDQTLNIQMQFDVNAPLHIDYEVFWVISGQCDASVTLNDGFVDIDVQFGIDPETGELTIEPADINSINLTGIGVSSGNCGGLAAIVDTALNLFASLLDSFLGDLILDLVRPLINDLFQSLLPDPLGIEGMLDMGSLLGAVSPGTNATLEVRGVPGGFVEMVGNGMTLGMILGINADEDIRTRTPDLDSEPAYCVPPVGAPDFSAAPASLPSTERGTFTLDAADEFRGAPDPTGDVAIGLSETMLDLAGHHAFTSGALCLGVGTKLVPQLNLGLFGLLVKSLSDLGDSNAPLLLATRPQSAIDFAIGEGTEASPSLTISLRNFEIDFYAFIYDRYVRGFTMSLTINVGLNLEFTTDGSGKPAILPMLVGLSAANIDVKTLNSEFLKETDTDLQNTLPTVLDLALPLVANGLQPIALPDFAGFTLGDLQTAKVVTSQDEFLAIFASLGRSQMLEALAERYPALQQRIAEPETLPARADTRARLRSVQTPNPERIRDGLAGRAGGDLPEIVIDVEPYDQLGRKLEWTWNINGGMWRTFRSESPLVIRDRALVWQGKYDIQVAARVAGDYRTLDLEPITIPVVIDSVGPRILADQARIENGALVVPATDLVSEASTIQFAYGHPGDGTPATEWGAGGLPQGDAEHLALITGTAGKSEKTITVYARDEQGNVTAALVDLGDLLGFHGSGEGGGCSCSASSASQASINGMALMAGLTMLLLGLMGGRRRPLAVRLAGSIRAALGGEHARRTQALVLYAGIGVGASTMPACDCGGTEGSTSCTLDEECDATCGEGKIGICLDSTCVCIDDVAPGRIGKFSDMSVASSRSVWVSGYNETHGDLCVARWDGVGPIETEAWEFVDGVPSGPVVVERSNIRGGIKAPGEDVGRHTSIAVNQSDEPLVSYYDVDRAALKFAARFGGVWQIHTIEEGVRRPSDDADAAFHEIGLYSSITVSQDGRPGIAYYAHVNEGGGVARTQVRFASASTPTPTGPLDWNIHVVDEVALPADPPADPLTVPPGLGLFVDSARRPGDDSPIIAYYDRIAGDLKLASFDAVAGTFAVEVLDGADGSDVGWYPSLAVDDSGVAHLSYVSATHDDLLYINSADRIPEVVDDGYRIVGTTEEGLPKPEFHFVGDDSSIVLTQAGPVIAYQDATTHELLLTQKNLQGMWFFTTVAGDEQEFAGGYGFYAAAEFDGADVIMSSFVVDQPRERVWVEIFRSQVVIK